MSSERGQILLLLALLVAATIGMDRLAAWLSPQQPPRCTAGSIVATTTNCAVQP